MWGTLARFAASGHAITIIYLTRGEAGITGKSHSEAAGIRTKESLEACKILNAKPVFAGQIDGDTIMNNEWVHGIYQCGHAIMEEFRDRELGVKATEGFVRMTGRGNGELIMNN